MGDVTTPTRCGRKPLDPTDPSVHVSISFPSKRVDVFRERAHRAGVTVPELIRRMLRDVARDRRWKARVHDTRPVLLAD
jgi:hypothetical protein